MAEQILLQSTCRAIWALLEKGDAVTIDHACEASQQTPWAVFRYFQLLEGHDYLALASFTHATGDEIIATFTLTKRTGRYAPYVDNNGQFVDPNLPCGPQVRPKGIGMTARVRITAELFDRPFSIEELRRAVTKDSSEYRRANKIIWMLKNNAELVEVEGGWEFRPDITSRKIRKEIKRRFIGVPFSFPELGLSIDQINPIVIRRIFSDLKAEGFKVTVSRLQKHRCKHRTYLVEAP